ncbi:MAG: hypothetical protein AMS27_00800 [Bacteroides sp. SM23_62_1]|nr:MAG: hypothetical protein AMS27_00800 [Bacteroides sp. SM23_62_1]
MVKISTLLYICDNLESYEEKLIDLDPIIKKEGAEYREVWDFLDNLLYEVDQDIVKKIMTQISQL